MALPLPKVVADVGPGGPLVSSMRGGNALLNDMNTNRIKGAEADYAPYTTYANAKSKLAYANMLPYQIQATILSNPLLWAAYQNNPQALSGLMENFAKSLPKGSSVTGDVNLPEPQKMGNQGNGLLSMLLGKLGVGSNNPLQSGLPPQLVPSEGSPLAGNAPSPAPTQQSGGNFGLIPAMQGGAQGILGSKTAPFNQSPYKPGVSAKNPVTGEAMSVPSESTTTRAQEAIIGINNAIPILNNIAKGGEKFLDKGGNLKLIGAQIDGLLKQYAGLGIPKFILDKLGIDPNDVSDYAAWRSDIEKAPETLMKAFQLPENELSLRKLGKIVEPIPGESGSGYANRVIKELKSLKEERLPRYKDVLGGGIPLSQKNNDLVEGVVQETKEIDGKEYVRIGNNWYGRK